MPIDPLHPYTPTSVDVVSEEEVGGLDARLAPVLEQVQQVEELPVDVAHSCDGRLIRHAPHADMAARRPLDSEGSV